MRRYCTLSYGASHQGRPPEGQATGVGSRDGPPILRLRHGVSFWDGRSGAPRGIHQGMKMNHRPNRQALAVAQVRALLASAAIRANQVTSAAERTLDCLEAFTG